MKPIDYLDIDNCPNCFLWIQVAHYEVPEKTYFGCRFIDGKVYAKEPCKVTDYHVCPLRKDG